jgi:hypothetical protein
MHAWRFAERLQVASLTPLKFQDPNECYFEAVNSVGLY